MERPSITLRQLNLELLAAPEPFIYAWGKKGFRNTIILVSVLNVITAFIFALQSPQAAIEKFIFCILLFALGESAAVSLGLSIYKALNKEIAIRTIAVMGAFAELYTFSDQDEAAKYDEAFLLCIELLEHGRGRPWLGSGTSQS